MRTYQSKIVIWRDRQGDFYWRLLGANGREICESTESYSTRRKCEEAVQRFRLLVTTAAIVESAETL
jgi:uncharacterized protein YegP (UPF0339 family)